MAQTLLIFMPIGFMIETIYKKNSSHFKSLLLLTCLTTASLFTTSVLEVDIQSLMYCGLLLWTHAFLLKDNTVASVICYSLCLNCSVDGLLYLPFLWYKVCCKLLK